MFLRPYYSLLVADIGGVLAMALFYLVGGVVVAMSHAMHGARIRAEHRGGELAAALAARDAADAALRAERERYRVTLAAVADALVATDADGRVAYLNPVAESLTGWLASEARDRPLEEVFRVIDAETGTAAESLVRQVLTGGSVAGPTGQLILLTRNGAGRPVDTSAAPIREATGRVVGFVLVFRDMTDRRRVEEELRASETRFRQLADAMPQIVWVTRPDGYHEYYNRRWYDYIGCTPEECLGYGWSDPLHPDDRERSQRRWQESLRTGEPYEVEYRFRSRDGEYRWFLGRALPVRDEAGGIVKWFGTCTDIHDRKLQAEEKARLLDALREADRRKNEFLATLAHELRNPLAAVRNGLHLLRVSPPGADLTDVREMLERQVAHMTRLIEDLLDLGRINNGKIRLITGAVDLAAVAARATDLARPLAEAHRQSIDLDRPPSPVWVNGDEVRLAQIVNNLLTNASKYTPEGGHLHVAVCAEAEEAILRVHDDGVGIEPAMLEKVFEMFSQERDSESRAQGGLGIGLTLVRALAALHGGTVSAASPGRGQGSTFTVRLPLSREVPTSAPLPTVETGSAGPAARRVLIADDNADAAGTLACLLGAFGHDARVAHDGPAALATAAEFRPDVVLLDIGMPGLSGLEVARRLRGMPAGRGATLVAVTGYGHDDDRRRSREAGCDAHLVKPVDPEAILRLLEASPGRRGEA